MKMLLRPINGFTGQKKEICRSQNWGLFFINVLYLVLNCRFSRVLIFSFRVTVSADAVKAKGCVISCCASAHFVCSSCFNLTLCRICPDMFMRVHKTPISFFHCVTANPISPVCVRVSVSTVLLSLSQLKSKLIQCSLAFR